MEAMGRMWDMMPMVRLPASQPTSRCLVRMPSSPERRRVRHLYPGINPGHRTGCWPRRSIPDRCRPRRMPTQDVYTDDGAGNTLDAVACSGNSVLLLVAVRVQGLIVVVAFLVHAAEHVRRAPARRGRCPVLLRTRRAHASALPHGR